MYTKGCLAASGLAEERIESFFFRLTQHLAIQKGDGARRGNYWGIKGLGGRVREVESGPNQVARSDLSVVAGFYQFVKIGEERIGVAWAGSCLRVVLDRENREFIMP